MFALTSNITIGAYRLRPHEVRIEKSVHSYRDTAVVKLPATARLKRSEVVTMVETAAAIAQGDAVTIQLGYNGQLREEFTGFVRRVNLTTPVEVECEGYSYQLRRKSDYERKTYTKVQLRQLLRVLIAGTDIQLATNVPDFVIEKFVMDGRSGTECLEAIKKLSAGTLVFFFEGRLLHAGMLYLQAADGGRLPYLEPGRQVRYRLDYNVASHNELKLRQPANEEVTVRMVGRLANGEKVSATANAARRLKDGSAEPAKNTGEIRRISSLALADKNTLALVATAKQELLSYTGYEGRLTAFLQPYCQPNMLAEIIDKKYPERSGRYLVVSTTVTYGMAGARRIVQVGKKVYD